MPHYPTDVAYSDNDKETTYEYRHVFLPKQVAKDMLKITGGRRLLTEEERRGLGVQRSRGWEHYEFHRPKPHILVYRRRWGKDPTTPAMNHI